MKKIITPFQVYLVAFISIAINVHVLLIPYILLKGGRDSWLSIVVAFGCMLPLLWLMHRIQKVAGEEGILAYIYRHFGRWDVVIRIALILWLLVTAAISMRDVIHWAHVSFLTFTPVSVLTIFFALTCAYSAALGLRVLVIVTGILLPIVCTLGFFVGIGNLSQKDYALLLPFLEHGVRPVWDGAVFALAGLCELLFILLLAHHARGEIKSWHWVVFAALISALAIGPTTAAIASFGPWEAMKQRFPVYEQWRLLRVGRYISHTDFLAIFQWLSGAFLRISLAWFLIADLSKRQHTTTRISPFLLGVLVVCTISLAWIPQTDLVFTAWMVHYIPLSLLYIVGILGILGGGCAWVELHKKRSLKRSESA